MSAERILLHRTTPDLRKIQILVDALQAGAIIIIPTDTIYALACDMENKKGVDQICKLLGKKPNKTNLSLLCKDLSELSLYCRQIQNPVFKLMKRLMPGPYTFILTANNHIAKVFRDNKKTVGIRVPDHDVVHAILDRLERPLVSSSIHSEDEILDYLTEPDDIYNQWKHKVSHIVDAGAGSNIGSTVIDCTEHEPIIIREGMGMDNV
ncbi:MAG: tRNA threonylcarbamoyl adenosine modification protein (Sua5/YciO/YrdC/YwlC family) [Bacteroidia bacterium]|jgi:tRNA threonylcarbamoyl adenosine modification protein (Sua5/YciO/YrdC/YwlC family)